MIPADVHRFAIVGTALFASAVVLAAAAAETSRPWEGWEMNSGRNAMQYGERVRLDRPIRTRANTYSNLAWVAAGMYACGFALADRKRLQQGGESGPANIVVATPLLSALFGLACIWLGFASGLAHASLTRAGQRLDVAAMYPPLLALLAIAAARRLPVRLGGCHGVPTSWVLAAIIVVAEIGFWIWKWQMSSKQTLLVLVGAVSLVALVHNLASPGRFRPAWAGLAAVLLAVAIACRQTDAAGTFPVGPDSWFQGHALWHVFTAGSILAMYLHERSEARPPARALPLRAP